MWVWSIIVGVVSQMWVWLVIVGMPRLHVEKVTQSGFHLGFFVWGGGVGHGKGDPPPAAAWKPLRVYFCESSYFTNAI